MGTPEFAIPSLTILISNNYSIVGVVTVPDKPSGRGQRLAASPVKKIAMEHRLAVFQPDQLNEQRFVEQMQSLRPDIIVVVAFRILPKEIFLIPRCGAFNLHASLLPKYRGAAPINWAIINGEKETGITTFFLQEKVDTGNIILQARVAIREDETAGELHDTLSEVGAELVLHTVRLIEMGKAQPQPQDSGTASSAPKIFKEMCKIDWHKSASELHNFIRGLSPRPCAYTGYKGMLIKLYRSRVLQNSLTGTPGEILSADGSLVVSTGNGVIEILELQQEGKKMQPAEEFLRGFHLKKGELFS